jgi:6-phosphogluconolactonase
LPAVALRGRLTADLHDPWFAPIPTQAEAPMQRTMVWNLRNALRTCGLALAALGMSSLAAPLPAAEPKGRLLTFFGTYTNSGKSKGIYSFQLELSSGVLTPLAVTEGLRNPSFLAIHPTGKFLYAVSEVADNQGSASGAVAALAIDHASGRLTLLNQQSSQGAGPCHVSVDRTGQVLLVANYNSGSVASLPILPDGRLGKAASAIQHRGSSVDPRRQTGPHAHSINVSPDNRFALVADLGLDQVLVYRLDPANATLTPHDPPLAGTPPGGGPRHLAFHPSGKWVYVCNEMLSSVSVFAYDAAAGKLAMQQTIGTLPEPVAGNTTAEILVHPSGRFVYCSNRGHDSLAIFEVDPTSGRLRAVGHQSTLGRTPRNFGLVPDGSLLVACNQATDNVVVFKVDSESGKLAPLGASVAVPVPVCVKFLAAQ